LQVGTNDSVADLRTPRKAALIHYTSWPAIGGVETILRQQAECLLEDGFEVQLLVGFGKAFSKAIPVNIISDLNGHDPAVAAAQKEAWAGLPGPAFKAVTKRLQERLSPILADCSAVIVHNYLTMPFNLAGTAVLSGFASAGAPVIAWAHDLAALNVDYQIPANSICDLLRKKLSGVVYVTVSEQRAQEFKTLTGQAPDLTIPNGIDFGRLTGLPPELETLLDVVWGETVILFYPARIVRRKNVQLAIEILEALLAQRQPARLILSGGGRAVGANDATYLFELRCLIESRGLQKQVIWAADYCVVDEACLRALYLISDALLFCSRQEGFGLALMEAAFLRLPVFCSDIEPLRTIGAGSVNVFDLKESPARIASTIRDTLIEDQQAANRRKQLRQYSARRVYLDRIRPLLSRTFANFTAGEKLAE
jgi:mannosylglucosylglycerate synthase